MMQALIEIMYERGPDGTPSETARECVRPEFWKLDLGRVYLKEAPPSSAWIDLTMAMALLSTPKFALVPIEEARSWDAFCDQAQRLLCRSAAMSAALNWWARGDVPMIDALRCGYWCSAEGIASLQSYAPVWCEPLTIDSDNSIEAWLGRAAEVVIVFCDVLARAGRWLELQNPEPISVNGRTMVYSPPADIEARRQSELAKIKMMEPK